MIDSLEGAWNMMVVSDAIDGGADGLHGWGGAKKLLA